MRLKEARKFGQDELGEFSPSSGLDTDVILQFITNKNRSQLLTQDDQELTAEQIVLFKNFIKRRREREPVAYITGEKEFFGLAFKVDERALIPRPETELLVEESLKYLSEVDDDLRILELGVGSACISIAIATELRKLGRNFHILASDVSSSTLELAEENVNSHGFSNEISLCKSNWFKGIEAGKKFNLIVSNPPYVADGDSYTSPELQYEPSKALYAGPLGMDAIKVIVEQAVDFLKDSGLLLFEHGYDQKDYIYSQCESSLNKFSKAWTIQDLAGKDRVTLAIF